MRQSASLARMVAVRARPWLLLVLAAMLLAALAAVSPAAAGGRDHAAAPAGQAAPSSVTDQVPGISPGAPRYAPARSWLHRGDPAARVAAGPGGQPLAELASDHLLQLRGPAATGMSRPGIRVGGMAAGSVGSRAPPL